MVSSKPILRTIISTGEIWLSSISFFVTRQDTKSMLSSFDEIGHLNGVLQKEREKKEQTGE